MLGSWTSPNFYVVLAGVLVIGLLIRFVLKWIRYEGAASGERFDDLLRSGALNPNPSNVPSSYNTVHGIHSKTGITEHAYIDAPNVQLAKHLNSITTTDTELDNIDR